MLVSILPLLLSINFLYSPVCSKAVLHNHRGHVGSDNAIPIRRQAITSPVHAVLGVRGLGVDTTHPRLEIRELEHNKDQLNLYLLGLQRFQSTNQEDKLSYYQVAGIHGRPFIAWDGVEKHYEGGNGYCAHGSNIFPIWHRPYLALIEELIYSHAREVVSEFPNGEAKDRMENALATFRIPYWDAAAVPPVGTGSYPWIIQAKTIEVENTNGNTTTRSIISNPLYAYTFHPVPIDDFRDDQGRGEAENLPSGRAIEPWILWNSTKRYPTNQSESAQSQDHLVAYGLDMNANQLRERTYQMLAMQKDYHSISNNLAGRKDTVQGGVPDSLESLHDTLHNTVGARGHMWATAYSAFDPIFWLLHANTDRMLAIWQALNPDSYVTNHTNRDATFTAPANSYSDENTPLHPFHRNEAGEFWTSASVRGHTVFGYTYPELIGLTDDKTLVQRVNALYGPNATSHFSWELEPTLQSVSETGPNKPSVMLLATSNSPSATTTASVSSTSVVQYHYVANVRTQKYGSEGAIKVYVFLGAVQELKESSSDASRWMSDPGFVGYTGFQHSAVKDSRGAQQMDMKMNGVIALTHALEDRARKGQLGNLDEIAVGTYLQEHMAWKIAIVRLTLVIATIPIFAMNG
ncbi:hypothetical protein BKA66DRAFT_580691 [Pyrenochaeta sp. MPI-SDFR-AT-0127]|nr:hypothetical protein BKA66DRAFT_580691 [Pyrenochaeta sp. MPI-SDFR-AT-0127]